MTTDWSAWHECYENPNSALTSRRAVVQDLIRGFLDGRSGEDSRIVSLCAGTGSDVLGVLSSHPDRARVTARLVELQPDLADRARDAVRAAGLTRIEVVAADAGRTDAYLGAVPADMVIACGVFGNISDHDVERTVRAMPSLCRQGGIVIWTRHRRDPDLTPAVRQWFAHAGFVELAFSAPGTASFAVGAHRLEGPSSKLLAGRRLFTFTR